ncbi:DUF2515 domain-containing protein [Brevibacillus sp. WF146]|uniref:DUF2515 family protein n=1 Tax=Brevibacillus sp. WF146 TaxID=319501 RepID=UPI0007ED112F|nr:DUF2515 family protein [Brevibacillus sp. WF146]UYZ11496.1 DUF2515 domain-containing protein [Brevibacillus sp. WF146]
MSSLITHDMSLVADIRRRTAAANRNNVSRTAAYLAFYREHPEVHWALLAHLVSRNGGWSMTDLRGEWLPRLMDEQDIRAFFWFLERSNWLIFHDAYAQLLLFAEMKRTGTDLTPLLPRLGVSRFMQPVWREFLAEQDSVRLTRALIVNEQQYIEQRVVRKPFAREQVFANLAFLAQSVLSLNQVLLPYKAHPADRRLSVVGIAVHNFPSVRQRISVGKTLYRLLFADARRHEAIVRWATRIPHTGSRSDYWPHLFSPKPHGEAAENVYRPRIDGADLQPGRPKLYSPALSAVWPDVEHAPADGVDWYRDEKWQEALEDEEDLPTLDSEAYLRSLRLVEEGLEWITALT